MTYRFIGSNTIIHSADINKPGLHLKIFGQPFELAEENAVDVLDETGIAALPEAEFKTLFPDALDKPDKVRTGEDKKPNPRFHQFVNLKASDFDEKRAAAWAMLDLARKGGK